MDPNNIDEKKDDERKDDEKKDDEKKDDEESLSTKEEESPPPQEDSTNPSAYANLQTFRYENPDDYENHPFLKKINAQHGTVGNTGKPTSTEHNALDNPYGFGPMGSFASLFANEPAHPVTNFANYILSNTTLSGEAGTSSQVSQSQPSSSSSSSSSSNTRSNLRPKAKYHLIKYLTILPTIYEENDEFPDTSEDEEEEDDSCGSPHDTHHY